MLFQAGKVHYVRPAANPLFESAVAVFGRRTLGIVLTGMGPDGAKAINRVHGAVVVQDPAVAEAYAMLTAVIERYAPDIVLPLRSIANALVALVMAPDAAALSSRASVAFSRRIMSSASVGPTYDL